MTNEPDPDKKEFILKNYKHLSVRQIAKRLEISRADVEAVLSNSKGAAASAVKENDSWVPSLLWMSLIFLIALVVRLLYLRWLSATPFFEPLSLYAKSKVDDAIYVWTGREMSRGLWLGVFPLGAYRIPLYAYVLGVCFRLFGPGLLPVHLIQVLLGAANAVLIYRLAGRALRNEWAARVAGLIGGWYVPFIFFEHVMVGETLSIFLNLLAMESALLAMGHSRRATLKILLSGLFFGASCLLRPNTLVAAVFAGGFLFYYFATTLGNSKKICRFLCVFFLGVCLPVGAITARNWVVYKDFLPLSAIGGINFYMGNGPEADGKFRMITGMGSGLDQIIENSQKAAESKSGRSLKPSEVSSYWFGKTIDFMRGNPARVFYLLLKKIVLFFNYYELSDILDIGFVSEFIGFLKLNLLGYGVLVLSAVVGVMPFFGKKEPAVFFLLAFFLGYLLSVILFIVTARYRLPAVPILAVFSANGFVQLFHWIKDRNGKALMKAAAACFFAAVVVYWPIERNNFATDYNSLGIALKYRSDPAGAEKAYRNAIRIAPNYPSPYFNLAKLFESQGKDEEAASLRQTYDRLRKTVFREA